MNTNTKWVSIFLIMIICLTAFSITGCGDDDDPLGLGILKLSGGNPTHYEIPGTKSWIFVVCEPETERPKKPVYVWTISHNGEFIEEIMHDSEPATATKTTDTAYSSFDDDLRKYSWPNSNTLTYNWSKTGTYTAKVNLYEYNDYSKDKNKAKILASFTHTIHCDNAKLSLVATPTANSREFTFKATADKPKFLPFGCPVKWEFIEESTGAADTGTTEQISSEYALFEDGVLEVDHQFQKGGKYKVIFTVVGYGTSPIASAETMVDVSQDLQIIVPSGPLKTGKEYTFTARTDSMDNLPDAPSYEWDFGDGNGLIIPFSNDATHLYEIPGKYTVRVLMFESDDVVAPLLGVATVDITVEQGDINVLEFLQKTTHLAVYVRGDTTYHQSDGYTRPANGCMLGVYYVESKTTWNGTHFTNSYFSPPTGSSSGIDLTIDGDVSEKGDKVTNVTATIIYDDSHRLAGERRETKISILDVELEPASTLPKVYDPSQEMCFVAYVEGPDVALRVTSTFFEHLKPQTSDPGFKMWNDPLQFLNTQFTPYLLVVFKTNRIDANDDPGYHSRD